MSFDLSTAQTVEGPVVITTPPEPKSEEGMSESQKNIEKAVLGSAGAGVGMFAASKPFREGRLRRIAEEEAAKTRARLAEEAKQLGVQQSSGKPPVNIDPSTGRIVEGTTKAGQTGRSLMTFNEETARRAAAQRQAYSILEQIGLDPQAKFAQFPGTAATKSGVVYPASEPSIKGGPPVSAPVAPAARSGLDVVTDMYRSMMGKLNGPLRIFGPIAGGISGGLDIANLRSQFALPPEQRDVGKMIESGTSLAGGAMSLIPGGQVPGLGLSLAAPLVGRYLRNEPMMEQPQRPEPFRGMPPMTP
jgi:hypothetical protein